MICLTPAANWVEAEPELAFPTPPDQTTTEPSSLSATSAFELLKRLTTPEAN